MPGLKAGTMLPMMLLLQQMQRCLRAANIQRTRHAYTRQPSAMGTTSVETALCQQPLPPKCTISSAPLP